MQCILAGHNQQVQPAGGRVAAAAKEADVGTLVDVLVGSAPEFTTLVAAVKAADLVGTLSGGKSKSKILKLLNFMFIVI